MESFGNLGYTLGGNIQPGSGTARFGYTPNPVNPPSFPPPVNNRSPYGQTNGWNGWQYNNPNSMPPNNNQGGETFDPNNGNGNPHTNVNNNTNNNSVGFNQNQNNMDWRNLQQSGNPPQYQPVTTTGPSSFQFRDPQQQQMAPSYPYPYNLNSYSNNNTSNSKNHRNNNNNNMMGHYGQGAASMVVPTSPNPFGNTAIPAIIEEKPFQCHVKIGDQGQQPIVYVGGVNPNEKNAQNYNSSNANNNQVQYNHSAGEPQQQQQQQQQPQIQVQVSQIQQSQQQQQQQPQMQSHHVDTTQMMNQINAQIQNHNQHQQQPQQIGQMGQMVQAQAQNLGQSQNQQSQQGQIQSQSQRNMTTPCGCCAACRAQLNNKMLGANQPQIVRGPKVQPRQNMMKTTSAPQMNVPNVENQMMMMQQQQQQMPQHNMNNMNGNQGDVNQVPVSVPICQVPQGQTNLGNMPIPVPIPQHQQYRQPFLS